MAKTRRGRKIVPARRHSRAAVARYRRSSPVHVSGRYVRAIRLAKGTRHVGVKAHKKVAPAKSVSVGIIKESDLQSTDVKEYLRTRLSDNT